MHPFSVVIAVGDCIRAEDLAIALHPFFQNVLIARDEEELRRKIARERAAAAVVDLDLLGIDEVAALCRDFNAVNVVCTHRVPDEAVWMKTLRAGASDCCFVEDFKAIQEALTPRDSLQTSQKDSSKEHAA